MCSSLQCLCCFLFILKLSVYCYTLCFIYLVDCILCLWCFISVFLSRFKSSPKKLLLLLLCPVLVYCWYSIMFFRSYFLLFFVFFPQKVERWVDVMFNFSCGIIPIFRQIISSEFESCKLKLFLILFL